MKISNEYVQRFDAILECLNKYNLNSNEKEQAKNQVLKFLDDIKEKLYTVAGIRGLSINKWNLMASKISIGGKNSESEKIIKNHKKRWSMILYEFSLVNELKILEEHLLEHLFVLRWLIKLEKG